MVDGETGAIGQGQVLEADVRPLVHALQAVDQGATSDGDAAAPGVHVRVGAGEAGAQLQVDGEGVAR